MRIVGFIIAAFIGLSPTSPHPVHVSQCEIYREGSTKIEFVFKIFYDDLQSAMGLVPGDELPADYNGSDALIESFLRSNFSVKIVGKKSQWKYLKSKSALPAVWTTVVIDDPAIKNAKSLTIVNTIMNSQFVDQKNIINNFTINPKQVILLDRKTTVAQINL